MIMNEGCVIDLVIIVTRSSIIAFRFNSMADPLRNPPPKDKMLGEASTESSLPQFNNGPQEYKLHYPLAVPAYGMIQFLHFGSPGMEK